MKHAIFFVFSFSLTHALVAGKTDWEKLKDKVQQYALELAAKVSELYVNRCNLDSLLDCSEGNYDECSSVYPNQICTSEKDIAVSACGDGTSCSSLYDYTVSNVRFGPGIDPEDHQVIETICFTRTLDEWFINKTISDKSYWENLGVAPPSMHFGSLTGAFRIFPARQSIKCNDFDPRTRPWYIAGSSGPKNVVLVLDTSHSMNDFGRLDRMKEAAIQIVETLTVSDRIAIVPFQTNASLIADDNGYIFTATSEKKEFLIQQINNLTAVGETNFQDAFKTAFDVLERSADQELITDCNTAVLFLTDGKMTDPDGETPEDVLTYVNERIDDFEALTNQPVFLFTYSVASQDDEDVHTFPRELACSTKYGVWSKIDSANEILDSLTGYYRFFALGLGDKQNIDFTAWVEPYVFASGIEGSTISAPVYDRSKSTPLFLGVVGIDLRLSVVKKIYGDTPEALTELKKLSDSNLACPSLNLPQCTLESFRRQGNAGANATCTTNCSESDYVDVEEQSCATVKYYPTNLFINTDNENLNFSERACCKVGESVPSVTCLVIDHDPISPALSPTPKPPVPIGAIVGLVLGCLALVVALAGGFVLWRRNK